jgi:hypothetical protein
MRPSISLVFYTFHGNHTHIDNLFRIHTKITGGVQGQGRNLTPSLLRATLVFMCASWETFVEDICLEGARILAAEADDVTKIPNGIKTKIANDLREKKNPLDLWQIGGGGWKSVLMDKVLQLSEGLNTPNSANVGRLFEDLFNLQIKRHWRWQGMTAEAAVAKLDTIVRLRGGVAHGRHGGSLNIQTCKDYSSHIERLVSLTAKAVDEQLTFLAN